MKVESLDIEDDEPDDERQCPSCGQEMLPEEGHCIDDMCHGLCNDCCVHHDAFTRSK